MTNLTLQYGAAAATFILAIAVLNPFHIFMPTMLAMGILAAFFLVFCLFAIFVMREKAIDERDEQHRALAGRAAFLVGATLLIAGIVLQDLAHALDPWLVIALAGMLIGKIGARIYSDTFQ